MGCLEENNGEISRPLSCSLSLSKGAEGKAKYKAAIKIYSLREIFCKKHLSTEKHSVLICNFGTLKTYSYATDDKLRERNAPHNAQGR